MPVTRIVWLALLLGNAALAQLTELYRSVGPDGTVTFSDRPQGANSERIFIGVNTPAPAPNEDDSDAPSVPDSAASPAQAIAVDSRPEDISEQRARNCAQAQQSLDVVVNADSLYRILPDGTREALDDENVATAREQAQAEVARWCT